MPNVFLRYGEIASLLQGIEVATAFYKSCKSNTTFAPVVAIFNDTILQQELLREKLETYTLNKPKE